MQVTMSQVLLVLFSLFIFQVSRMSLVNPFARVCSQHICTVVCSLTHKLYLSGKHTHAYRHTHQPWCICNLQHAHDPTETRIHA